MIFTQNYKFNTPISCYQLDDIHVFIHTYPNHQGNEILTVTIKKRYIGPDQIPRFTDKIKIQELKKVINVLSKVEIELENDIDSDDDLY